MAGGNSAGSVPGVVELAPVFGNGGAPASRRRLRAVPDAAGRRRPDYFRYNPTGVFVTCLGSAGALVGGASLAAGGRASPGAFSAAAAGPLNAFRYSLDFVTLHHDLLDSHHA